VNRNIKKNFWFNRREVQELQRKARKACLTESALVRLLILGYEPKEKPDERFYEVMRELNEINMILHRLVQSQNVAEGSFSYELSKEIKRWGIFQNEIEQKYLRPKVSNMKWQ